VDAQEQTPPVCAAGGYYAFLCAKYESDPKYGPLISHMQKTNWSTTSEREREKHEIADFSVGRDLGLGVGDASLFSVGLRYADLDSRTSASFRGMNWDIPEGFAFPFPGLPVFRRTYTSQITANRMFEGFGPVLSWESSLPFINRAEIGRVAIDWSISGGALFGKQKTSTSGVETVDYNQVSALNVFLDNWAPSPTPPEETPILTPDRSKSVSVPVVDLSLGFSYEVQRMKLSAGYHWERYFNVLDAGYAEHKSYDRTIDGPYFKIAVGFGG
jgi:hypothetical protein